MKLINLHVGFHKTGTSSFQHTCMSNRGKLEEQGFCYPEFTVDGKKTGNHGVPLILLFKEDAHKHHVGIRQGYSARLEEVQDAVAQQLEQVLSSHDNIIFSGEGIASQKQECLLRLKAYFESRGFRLRVFCGVRRTYSYMCSIIQQEIKGGDASLTPPMHVPTKSRRVRKLRKVFGDVEFFNFEKECEHRHGPAGALLERMGINCSGIEFQKKNTGIGNITTRLYDCINRKYPIIDAGRLNEQARDATIHNFDHDTFWLSAHELDAVRDQLDAENQQLGELLGAEFTDAEYKTTAPFTVGREMAFDIMARACKPAYIADAVIDFLVQHGDGSWRIGELFVPLLEASHLSTQATEYLRDQAIALEGKNLPLAYELMGLAARARPNGVVIQQKLKEYRFKLNRN